jgi:hypothetical protein
MNNQTITAKSPKNKFRIELISKKPIKGLGSSFSTGVMTLENLDENSFYNHYKFMIVRNGGGYVTIKENKKSYPEFQWENVKNFEI